MKAQRITNDLEAERIRILSLVPPQLLENAEKAVEITKAVLQTPAPSTVKTSAEGTGNATFTRYST